MWTSGQVFCLCCLVWHEAKHLSRASALRESNIELPLRPESVWRHLLRNANSGAHSKHVIFGVVLKLWEPVFVVVVGWSSLS